MQQLVICFFITSLICQIVGTLLSMSSFTFTMLTFFKYTN